MVILVRSTFIQFRAFTFLFDNENHVQQEVNAEEADPIELIEEEAAAQPLPLGSVDGPVEIQEVHDPGNCYSGPPISEKTFEGSFSAVWVATIATKYSFCSFFRRSFASLRKKKVVFFNVCDFIANLANFAIFE